MSEYIINSEQLRWLVRQDRGCVDEHGIPEMKHWHFVESIKNGEEVVRCRDCKRMRGWTVEEKLASYGEEELADGWCMFLRIGTYNDFFCAWRVRK